MTAESHRPYHSPLREEQVRKTRDLILDALTDLLADRRSDEITTREIAAHAGVSQPTVYRHFPDRTTLLAGITARINELASESESGGYDLDSIDEVGRTNRVAVRGHRTRSPSRSAPRLSSTPTRDASRMTPDGTPTRCSASSRPNSRSSMMDNTLSSQASCDASGPPRRGCGCARSSAYPVSRPAH